jgi:uncharacterized damage-inducible protein DinB
MEVGLMSELRRIADLLDRVGSGDAWHGSPVDATVQDLPARQAAMRPIANGHTIWELVLHIAVWQRVVARRLRGEEFEPSPAQDWPRAPEPTEQAWRDAVRDLRTARAELRREIERFDEKRLDATVQGKNYSFHVMLHGVIQHDLYHAGQIAILRKGVQ